jgi:OmpA-OmpF porin, OOP family
MPAQRRLLLCLAFAAVAALPGVAAAQGASTLLYSGPLKEHWWGRSALGLALNRSELRLACAGGGTACEEVSVVGKASVGESSVNLFGKVGSATHARTYALGADAGFGLSYGAGVSWDFSPRASATVSWDSYDLRAGGGPVRSTNLGLQLRY